MRGSKLLKSGVNCNSAAAWIVLGRLLPRRMYSNSAAWKDELVIFSRELANMQLKGPSLSRPLSLL